jgi:diaminopimelate epimerase
MATTIKFTKMQGTGNDYIYVNTLSSPLQDPIKAARKWSAYHTGIGADGLVLIGASEKADFSMRIFNADGSEAMMCGNASRCIGKYVYEKGLTDKEVITLETLSGIKILKLHTGNGVVKDVTVDMGTPLLSNPGQIAMKTGGMLAETILADGKEYKGTFVCMGNPHVVIFVDDIKEVDLPAVGPKLENHPLFPERTNVEFVEILPDQSPSFISSTKMTTCGFPMQTNVPLYSFPSARIVSASIPPVFIAICPGFDSRGVPISTVTSFTTPLPV